MRFHRRYNQAYEMYVAGYQFLVLNNLFMNHWGLQVAFISNHCTMGLSIALRTSKIRKSKSQILLNFDRNQLKLFETGEKTPKNAGKKMLNICKKKNVVLMDEKYDVGDCQSLGFGGLAKLL